MDDDKGKRPVDLAQRLVWIGFGVAAAIGVMWFAERRSHEDLADFTGDTFNSTPYAIGVALAVAVGLVGLILQNDRD